ncbi:MAG: ABC transporter ATP-binding protein [Gammaproteobacteria bacterium]|nr:ABC transporter ATP-binding protein [Gammaproteobacteria bacterium]
MAELGLSGIRKGFGDTLILKGVDLHVADGQLVVLVGPSGCGKSTLLRTIAGLELPDQGTIRIAGKDLTKAPPKDRDIGMVFQSYAIWPHMSVFENVAFPLIHGHHGKPSASEVRARVMRALTRVQLEDFADRPAPFLSGGQQQRVALARALVHEPPLLLFDEPLSNLDAKLREQMRTDVRRLTESLGMTTVYVTHDQIEALAMSDRIAVMRHGRIVQQGTPREVYFEPVNAFVAQFLGGGNSLSGTLAETCSARRPCVVRTALGPLPGIAARALPAGARVQLIVRPEGFRLHLASRSLPDTMGLLSGTARSVSFLGNSLEVLVEIGQTELRARLDPGLQIAAGARLQLALILERCIVTADDTDANKAFEGGNGLAR